MLRHVPRCAADELDDPLAEPARRSTLAELTEWTIWADKAPPSEASQGRSPWRAVLVLGAGFGGIAAATRLRTLLDPAHEVVLVDRRSDFVMGLRKTCVVLGSHPLDEGRRGLATLREHGISTSGRPRWRRSMPLPSACSSTASGSRPTRSWSRSARSRHQTPCPGLAEHGINVWDRTDAGRAHDALASLDRGRLLVGVFGRPGRVSARAVRARRLLARDALAARGADVSVEVFGPMPSPSPMLEPVQSTKVEALLEAAGIPFHRGQPATSVEAGVVHLADGRDLAFDLLLAVPPHRCPQVLVDAGLAQAGGWVEVDPRTLATPFEGVYVVGDATAIILAHGLPLPKAGLFAVAEGYVVAERVAAELAGRAATATFDGTGVCFAETGGGGLAGTTRGSTRPAGGGDPRAVRRCHGGEGRVRGRPPRRWFGR